MYVYTKNYCLELGRNTNFNFLSLFLVTKKKNIHNKRSKNNILKQAAINKITKKYQKEMPTLGVLYLFALRFMKLFFKVLFTLRVPIFIWFLYSRNLSLYTHNTVRFFRYGKEQKC